MARVICFLMVDGKFVADIDKTQSEVAALSIALKNKDALCQSVIEDIGEGRNALEELIQASDGLQICSEEIVSTYHRANVLFNIMRGGVFSDNYLIAKSFLKAHLAKHNSRLSAADLGIIDELPVFHRERLIRGCVARRI